MTKPALYPLAEPETSASAPRTKRLHKKARPHLAKTVETKVQVHHEEGAGHYMTGTRVAVVRNCQTAERTVRAGSGFVKFRFSKSGKPGIGPQFRQLFAVSEIPVG